MSKIKYICEPQNAKIFKFRDEKNAKTKMRLPSSQEQEKDFLLSKTMNSTDEEYRQIVI